MIVRIPGEGQFKVSDSAAAELNALDADVEAAAERDDEAAFTAALRKLTGTVRRIGSVVPADNLEPSDVILPPEDASLADVRKLLADEGLIPG